MARSIVLVCLVAWLMVALVATVSAVGDRSGIFSWGNHAKKGDGHEELAKKFINLFSDTDGANKLHPEKVVRHFDRFADLSRTVDMKDLPDSWKMLFDLRKNLVSRRGAAIESICRLAPRWQFSYAYHCLQDNLRKYGFEDQYKKAISLMKHEQWDLDKYPTLASYLMGEYCTQTVNLQPHDRVSPASISNFFEKFSKFEGTLDKNSCGDDFSRKKLVNSLFDSKIRYPQLLKLAKEYLGIFIHHCGYEEKFRDAMIRNGEAIDEGNMPFTKYLWGELVNGVRRISYPSEILLALQIVYNLHDSAAMESVYCTNSNTKTYVKQRNQAKAWRYRKFAKSIDAAFATYLAMCAHDFKRKAQVLESDQNKNGHVALVLIKEWAKGVESKILTKYENDPRTSRQIIADDFPGPDPYALMDEEEELPNVVDASLTACQLLREEMGPFVKALHYNICPAILDEEIKDLVNYLGYCYYKKLDGSIDEDVLYVFDKLGAPYYPTAAPAPTFDLGKCR